jgi:hypothetical protein
MNVAMVQSLETVSETYVEINCQLDATDDFYCRSYCLLNMFPAPLCPSSGAACGIWCFGFHVVGMVWS